MNNSILKYFICILISIASFPALAQHSFLDKTDTIIKNNLDEKIQFSFQACRNKPTDLISKCLISPWGNGIYSLPALGGLYISGAVNKNEQNKNAAVHALEAFALTAVTTSIFKMSFHRHRPCETDPPNSGIWDGPSFRRTNLSFPSGHTSSAFCIATVLASEYKNKPAVAAISFSLAGLVAVSRIYENKHWFTDVLAGAALGFGCGTLICIMNK